MPLVKHRDTLTDLIRKAAERKMAAQEQRKRVISYLIGASANKSDGHGMDAVKLAVHEDIPLRVSSFFLWIVEMQFVTYTRLLALVLAFLVLFNDSLGNIDRSRDFGSAISLIEIIVSSYYVVEGGLKLCSLYAFLEISATLKRHISLSDGCRRSGIADIVLSALCLAYVNNHDVSKWLHLVRCAIITLLFLEKMPQIDMLMVRCRFNLKSALNACISRLCRAASPRA
jgi:hypothetical protein